MANLFTSTIGKKLIMSITGLFLILFLVFHMAMNLVAIFSGEAYDMICAFLGANWYALIGTAVLGGGVAIHFLYASILTLRNRNARGTQRYAMQAMPKNVTWASRNMFIIGSVILLGLLLHLYNFWYRMQFVELFYSHEQIVAEGLNPTGGAALITELFANPIYCAVYLLWFVAIWFHLTHGFWSAIHSIGWDSQKWQKRTRVISNIVATVIMLCFAAIVVVFYLRSLCGGAC